MAYARFFDSDIYIYPHVGGWIECQACWLNEGTDEYSLFSSSEEIYDDKHLIEHIGQHRQLGHNIPDDLIDQILADPDRYGPKYDDSVDYTLGGEA